MARKITTAQLLSTGAERGREALLANASLYMELTGHLVIAWVWLSQASVALRALPTAGSLDLDFYRGKLQACRYFFRWELPRIEQWALLLERFDDTPLAMRDAWF